MARVRHLLCISSVYPLYFLCIKHRASTEEVQRIYRGNTHLGHFHGNASDNFWAAKDATPDADGKMTTTLTAPVLYGNDNDVTSTSYHDFAIVNTSAETWVSFERTYNVTFKEGTEDVGNWTVTPSTATAGQTVTVKYTGTKKVKSVKAVKK